MQANCGIEMTVTEAEINCVPLTLKIIKKCVQNMLDRHRLKLLTFDNPSEAVVHHRLIEIMCRMEKVDLNFANLTSINSLWHFTSNYCDDSRNKLKHL